MNRSRVKIGELAELVGGRLVGDPGVEVDSVGPLDGAQPGQIAFLANKKFLGQIPACRASALLVPPGVELAGKPGIVVDDPYLAFAKILTRLTAESPPPGGIGEGCSVARSARVEVGAVVSPGCRVGDNVVIGKGTVLHPNVVLYPDVVIGENCLVHANVVVREGCRIGDRVILQPGAIIGSDGFGFAPDGDSYCKIPQVGIVVIEDDVEIGAATCVDRATLGVTQIKRGTKIDNLVQIAHNVVIGEDTIIVSQVGIAGSTRVGRHCTFGGQAGIAGHVNIGDNVTIAARGGVGGDLKSDQVLSGAPVMEHRQWLKASMTFPKLPAMRKELSRLRQKVDALESLLKKGENS
jgi:UDP-3-O-[3-hydroxymyristoyl] glucosamine N-acyltransferase